MIDLLLSALIRDLLLFFNENREYFRIDEEKRRGIAEKTWSPGAVVNYVSAMTEQLFIQDLSQAMKVLKGQPLGKMERESSGLPGLLSEFFLKEFPVHFDQLSAHFFHLSESEQHQFLLKLFPQRTAFFHALRQELFIRSHQEIAEELVVFLREHFGSPRIIIQSPLECDAKTKAEIRMAFAEDYPKSLVVFSVNTQLIGGIRFFVDGKVDDRSWFSKVQDLRALAAHR
jgi:F0F1-type ATP synthase delta subunit